MARGGNFISAYVWHWLKLDLKDDFYSSWGSREAMKHRQKVQLQLQPRSILVISSRPTNQLQKLLQSSSGLREISREDRIAWTQIMRNAAEQSGRRSASHFSTNFWSTIQATLKWRPMKRIGRWFERPCPNLADSSYLLGWEEGKTKPALPLTGKIESDRDESKKITSLILSNPSRNELKKANV